MKMKLLKWKQLFNLNKIERYLLVKDYFKLQYESLKYLRMRRYDINNAFKYSLEISPLLINNLDTIPSLSSLSSVTNTTNINTITNNINNESITNKINEINEKNINKWKKESNNNINNAYNMLISDGINGMEI